METDRLREMRQWVRAYLARDEDIIVPIKKMWKELRRQLRQAGLEPPEDIWSRRPSG